MAAGIFHDFHHAWVEEVKRALNGGLLPDQYYAMAEQHVAGFGPDVVTIEFASADDSQESCPLSFGNGGTQMLTPPKCEITDETDMEFYRRRQNRVVIRHVGGDRVVSMVEVVSAGNKSTRHAMRSFVEKAAELLDRGIHLLLLDLHPPGPRDPNGITARSRRTSAARSITTQ